MEPTIDFKEFQSMIKNMVQGKMGETGNEKSAMESLFDEEEEQ